MDPDRMAQALGNLLSNAIKFTSVGGQLTITIEMDGKQLTMQVVDNGPGIPFDDQEKIFQPFYRGSQDRRIVQGMGLGLSITRDIVTAHGGEIELEARPGQEVASKSLHSTVAGRKSCKRCESLLM
jgi:signal transduction histidine kinase